MIESEWILVQEAVVGRSGSCLYFVCSDQGDSHLAYALSNSSLTFVAPWWPQKEWFPDF